MADHEARSRIAVIGMDLGIKGSDFFKSATSGYASGIGGALMSSVTCLGTLG